MKKPISVIICITLSIMSLFLVSAQEKSVTERIADIERELNIVNNDDKAGNRLSTIEKSLGIIPADSASLMDRLIEAEHQVGIDNSGNLVQEEETSESNNYEDIDLNNLNIEISDDEWEVTRPYTICKYYEKFLNVSPSTLAYLLVENNSSFLVTDNGKASIFTTIYDEDYEDSYEDFDDNIYDFSINGIYPFCNQSDCANDFEVKIGDIKANSYVDNYYDIEINVTDKKSRNGLIAYTVSSELCENTSTWYGVLFNGNCNINSGLKSNTPITSDYTNVKLLGCIFFEGELANHEISLGSYSYEIVESYTYYHCEGIKYVNGKSNECGLILVKVSKEGKDSYRIVYMNNGKAEISTYDSDMTTSNENLYSFEVIDFIPCKYLTNYNYHIDGTEKVIPSGFDKALDSIKSLGAVDYGNDWFSFDTNTNDSEYHDESIYLPYMPKILEMLGFPDSTYQKMLRTSASDGTVSDSVPGCTASWTYSKKYGLEVLFEKK